MTDFYKFGLDPAASYSFGVDLWSLGVSNDAQEIQAEVESFDFNIQPNMGTIQKAFDAMDASYEEYCAKTQGAFD